MSAALEVPFVAERDGWRIEVHDGYATLWVDEQVTDVADVLAECFMPELLPTWTVQAVSSEGDCEIYRLERLL